MISNPSNPTRDEIENWAYSYADEPDQEWELFLIWAQYFDDYLRFASDINCPKEQYFLNLLYYWVWRNIHHETVKNELDSFKDVFQLAERINTPYVKVWLSRAKEIMVNNQAFTETQWWEGRRPYDV